MFFFFLSDSCRENRHINLASYVYKHLFDGEFLPAII